MAMPFNESLSSLSSGLHERARQTGITYHMVDISLLSPSMYIINFRISVKCQFNCIFSTTKVTIGSRSMDQYGDILVI